MNHFNPIVFPGLGISIDPNPVAFNIFGKDIYWYGVIISIGFLLAAMYALKLSKREGIDENAIADMILIAAPVSIIFARAYYVIFNLSQFPDFWSMIAVWNGGIAVYGSIIGAFTAVVVYCKIKKLPVLRVLDIGAVCFMIGQAIGRWGNFINREAFGSITTLPWRMEIYSSVHNARIAVHPTFLYESLWNIIGFFIIASYYKRKKKFDGEILLLYLCWYGIGRAFIEGLRTDSLYFLSTGIRVSQMVGIVSFIVCTAILIYNYVKKPYLKAQAERSGIMTEDENKDKPFEHQGENEKQDSVEGNSDGGNN